MNPSAVDLLATLGERTETALCAAPALLDRLAVVGANDWTWREVHLASLELARRLDGVAMLVNLCATRIGFLVTWLAAWRAGCLQLLPPSGGPCDVAALAGEGGDGGSVCLVVVDSPAELPPGLGADIRRLVHVPAFASQPVRVADRDLTWAPDWDRPLVRFYTSGSTGTPEPRLRSAAQLVRGAQLLGPRLDQEIEGGLAALRRIVCSVAPQHMFGVEASVMLPLVHGLAVFEGRPLLPADIGAAFDAGRGAAVGALWVATPLHLRALARCADRLANCRAVLTSTMALAADLAAEVEALVDAPVLEIYGSTETGALALRRTAQRSGWTPLPGVTVTPKADATVASGLHFPSPQQLADRTEPAPGGGFELLGRAGDLIKIAGRRASLAGLDRLLEGLPGCSDAVFYLPASGAPTERMVLIHAGAPLDRQATLAWLRERIDPLFLPRALIRVDALPRAASGKLPRAALDAVYAGWRAARPNPVPISFEVRVGADHPALPGHFPGRPIVPGVLLLDRVFAGLQQRSGARVGALRQVKFSAALLPGETAQARCAASGPGQMRIEVSVERGGVALSLATASLTLLQGGPP